MPKRSIGWKEIQGDKTAALDWPIDENSIVFEIGGYEGRWALQMAKKFNPTIHVFEPQTWAMDRAVKKFEGQDEKTWFYTYGLWTHDGMMKLGDFGRDGASLLKPEHEDFEMVLMRDMESEVSDLVPEDRDIDVCLMNIEGGEFVLIPYMIGVGIMKRIKFFWAQFHQFPRNSPRKFEAIKEAMAVTHDVLWDFGMSMIAWRRRDA